MRAAAALLVPLAAADIHLGPDCSGSSASFKRVTGSIGYCPAEAFSVGAASDLQSTQRRCLELEDDCVGVSCTRGAAEECSVHTHQNCDAGPGNLLNGDTYTSYLKRCPLCDWAESALVCPPPRGSSRGPLEERKIRCHERGAECAGVTCFLDSRNCTLRAPCQGDDFAPVVEDPNFPETTYVKTCKQSQSTTPVPPIDVNGHRVQCEWKTFADYVLPCLIEDGPDTKGAPMDMKRKCVRMGAKCVGISCTADGTVCSVARDPSECPAGRAEKVDWETGVAMTHDEAYISHIAKCFGGSKCKDPCYSFDEGPEHNRCASDCDCDGSKECSYHGYCVGDSGHCHSGKDCMWVKRESVYISCEVQPGLMLPLQKAKTSCMDLNEKCEGVTCENSGLCSTRNHERCGGDYHGESPTAETSYVKLCGRSKTTVGSSGAGFGFGAAFLVVLAAAGGTFGALLYKNRMSARRHIGAMYAPATAHAGGEDQEDDWIEDPDDVQPAAEPGG
eukprot:TRINITY_DN1328_c5_g1_i2.p1 TRINITY_DN1328_c5_g1~~TRINITY_DN1328_c5_g1_i2.p1  ORF type:complete len:503 (+),score=128.84 TRINITY_DN1328_c5_g1_i2:145-1653(+)